MFDTIRGKRYKHVPTGKQIAMRGLTYYRLANGKIVEDDPVTTPDMMQALGIQMPGQPAQ